MNAGIIIAVSEYKDKTNDLLACAKDARLIYELLKATKKYDEHLLFITGVAQSTAVKQQVVQFINQLKGQPVEEVFFYYTGHGEFTGNEFYYLLSDYDPSARSEFLNVL